MKTVSLCMIVKNEEHYINKCLDSIKDIVDEIIIVDTGSTDKTKEICKKYTDKIFDFEWVNDFSAARNFSFSKATCDYIFWLDADDVLLEKDQINFLKLKQDLENINADYISMIYNYSFGSNGKPNLSFRRNRLVKRSINPRWVGFVHEIIDLDIMTAYPVDIIVTHTRTHSNTDRNLKIFEKQKINNKIFDTRDTLYYAKELFYNGKLKECISVFEDFLSKEDAWFEDKIDTLIKIYECYTQFEKSLKDQNEISKMKEKRREILFKTFNLTHPRAEALYRIALTYIEEKRYYEAIFYLESIFVTPYPENCPGFINREMWTILPNLQLCFLYYQIGNVSKSLYYHNKCLEIDPENEDVKFNEQYFKKIRHSKKD